MYTIYILEDDLRFSSALKSLLETYSKNHSNFSIRQIHITNNNFSDFMKHIPKKSNMYNIYLLDIGLNDNMNGLEIAKMIRRFDFDGYIIFLTSYVELMGCTFSYNIKALNFIDKGHPQFRQLLFSAFDQIFFESQSERKSKSDSKSSDNLVYTYKSFHYKIPICDILFIETHGLKRCLLIRTSEETFEYPKSLKTLVNSLPETFYRCHKSYIVNRTRVVRIELDPPHYKAFFNDNKSCPISKKYISNLMELIRT